jgi:ribonucleotide monophosphatase NagD (HAD superfamily)
MTKNLDSEGLKSIAENYDLFYIDLWGVMHNGIELHEGAIYTLKKLLEINKNFVLLTNAPRPIQPVKEFLEKMGMEEKYRNKVFTSGEAALNYLKKFYPQKRFYHIGPTLEILIYSMTFRDNKSKDINESHYLLCSWFIR